MAEIAPGTHVRFHGGRSAHIVHKCTRDHYGSPQVIAWCGHVDWLDGERPPQVAPGLTVHQECARAQEAGVRAEAADNR